MLTFGHLWFLALLPLPWLLRAMLPPRRTSRLAVRVPFGDRLRAASTDGGVVMQTTRKFSRQILPWLVWGCVTLALARPMWIEAPISKNLPTRDLLLLVDLSGSMRQEDFTNTAGIKVDRLTAVKEVLGEFLTRRDGDRVSLVVFGDAPFLQAPFSTDLGLSRRLLDETAIGMAGPRTAFGDAIGLGVTLFDTSTAPTKTIIALTDGNDTASQVPPAEAARVAKERGIRIHTIAMGDPTTAGEEKLDEAALRSVAKVSGGSYFFAGDRTALEDIYRELDQLETRQIKVVSHRPRNDLFHWPLIAALALWMLDKSLATLLRGSSSTSARPAKGTIRVDPLTGKLEVRA